MSSSESDAPETITLKTAKSQSKRQNKELEERHKLAARIKKEKNQARDVRLKAGSAGKKRVPDLQLESSGGNTRKKKGNVKEQVLEVDEERIRLERRMERAMAAAEEDDESGDTDDDSDVLMNEREASPTTEEENEDAGGDGAEVALNPDYLPEHYFEQLVSPSKTSSAVTKTRAPTLKRKRKAKDRIKQKEKVIGSRAIINLSSSSLSAVGRTTPSTNAKRFLRQRLKGDIRTKGWERKPVAIGSLASRTRPAAKFVRG